MCSLAETWQIKLVKNANKDGEFKKDSTTTLDEFPFHSHPVGSKLLSNLILLPQFIYHPGYVKNKKSSPWIVNLNT